VLCTGKLQTELGFRSLLRAKDVAVSESVMSKIISAHSARLLLCTDFVRAFELYHEIEALPQTQTVDLLARIDIHLDVIFFRNTKSILINAIKNGVPRVFKIPKTESEVRYEMGVWNALKDNVNVDKAHLVPLESIVLDAVVMLNTEIRGEVEREPVRFGLLMPKYSNAISHFKNVAPETILRWITIALSALQVIHKANYVNGDVKPDNIFLDQNGVVYLGD
jgi:serine/threonine protein kinase